MNTALANESAYSMLCFTKASKVNKDAKTLVQYMEELRFAGILVHKPLSPFEKMKKILNAGSGDFPSDHVICLLQNEAGVSRHAVAIDLNTKTIHNGYDSVPIPLNQINLNDCCGNKCKGMEILMAVKPLQSKKHKAALVLK